MFNIQKILISFHISLIIQESFQNVLGLRVTSEDNQFSMIGIEEPIHRNF